MNTAGIGNSYNKTLYDVGKSIKSDKSVPVKMGAVSQDMYVHSKEESSYVTYTPNGRVNGEDVFKNELCPEHCFSCFSFLTPFSPF